MPTLTELIARLRTSDCDPLSLAVSGTDQLPLCNGHCQSRIDKSCDVTSAVVCAPMLSRLMEHAVTAPLPAVKLLPCPFCGSSTAARLSCKRVVCDYRKGGCGAAAPLKPDYEKGHGRTPIDSLKHDWNRRAK